MKRETELASEEKHKSNSLVWFRTDLRTLDNPALYHGAKAALRRQGQTFGLFIFSAAEFNDHDLSPNKVDFMVRNLKVLSSKLWSDFRIPLLIRNAPTAPDVLKIVDQICKDLTIAECFYNVEYEVDEARRDKRVTEMLEVQGIKVTSFHDQIVVPPGILAAKSSGKPYVVYSPFRKAWYPYVKTDIAKYLTPLGSPSELVNATVKTASDTVKSKIETQELNGTSYINSPDVLAEKYHIKEPDQICDLEGFTLDEATKKLSSELFPAGELIALERLDGFANSKNGTSYNTNRNLPGMIQGTSGLSPYLACGVLTTKQCVVTAYIANNSKLDTGSEGLVTWIAELIWRDFYRHILVAFPKVCMGKPFKPYAMEFAWRFDEKEFKAWCEGRTGYPIVDAGMRQMNETGWMHNRVRMVVASFLTKHLLHNWQLGERYFMRHLIDGDFASNNGGWQWVAGTGADPQPFFRIFNPDSQSRKFDPNGDYIRRWIPELRSIRDSKAIHDPEEALGRKRLEQLGYPRKIVDHKKARQRALDAYKGVGKDVVE